MSQNLKIRIRETDVARFRVGNVRFGGGRKASIGFHGFGVGVTLGGGRKGGGGGGGSYEVIEIDWNSLTDKEKAETPLKQLRSLDLSLISPKDAALIKFRRERQWSRRIALSIAAAFIFLTSFTIFSPFIFSCLSLASLSVSIVFLIKLSQARKVKAGAEPTNSQLLAWAFVNNSQDANAPKNDDKLLDRLNNKYGTDAVAHVNNFVKQRILKPRSFVFKEMVLGNIAFNLLLVLLSWLAVFMTNDDYALLCQKNEFGNFINLNDDFVNKQTVVFGINYGCDDLFNRMNYFRISIGFVGFSIVLSLVLAFFTYRKQLNKDLIKSLKQILAKSNQRLKANHETVKPKPPIELFKSRTDAEKSKRIEMARKKFNDKYEDDSN